MTTLRLRTLPAVQAVPVAANYLPMLFDEAVPAPPSFDDIIVSQISREVVTDFP